MEAIGKQQLLEMLLARAPDRLVDALAAASGATGDLAALRADLAELASSVEAVAPPASLRARLLGARPRVCRPQRPVVLVLDMLNDHLRPGGPLEVPRARSIVPALAARLADARAHGIPVVYVNDAHEADDTDFDVWPIHNLAGSDGADVWPALAPQPGDRVVTKPTYSGFTRSKLADVLDELGADEIILTGCATEVGIQATAVDALERGYVVQIPPDAQAGMSPMTEGTTLLTLSTLPPYDPIYRRRRAEPVAAE
jgi:nicotinamidase-related amidase